MEIRLTFSPGNDPVGILVVGLAGGPLVIGTGRGQVIPPRCGKRDRPPRGGIGLPLVLGMLPAKAVYRWSSG